MSDSLKSLPGMVPQLGVLAVVLTVVATLFSGKPKAPDKGGGGDTKEVAAAKDEATPGSQTGTHIDQLRKFGTGKKLPWLLRHFYVPRPEVDFLILTIPDPVATQFAAQFDELVDVTSRALADVGPAQGGPFVLSQYWYPWQTKQSAARGRRPHEMYPGLLVFRGAGSPDRRKVVLLVGENPMSGVQPLAMRAALDLASLGEGPIRIVGPSFSGTQASLNQLIGEWRKAVPKTANRPIQLVSGRAFAVKHVNKLSPAEKDGLEGVSYRITRVPSEVHDQAIWHYLSAFGTSTPADPFNGKPPEKLAYLIESNSGYGNMSAKAVGYAADKPWVLRFPMHMSRLSGLQSQADRQRDERLGLVGPGGEQLKRLDETRHGEDLLPSTDEARTALINQRLLEDYWETIRREQVQYVGVVATDVRDKIFLIGRLRRACPNVIAFTIGSDLQLAHPEYLADTRGTLVVSTYPLYPAAQQWAKRATGAKADPRRVPFASDGGEGTYNAVLVQCESAEKMLDYRPPTPPGQLAWSRHPAVWISAIGNDGTCVPLAYFFADDHDSDKLMWDGPVVEALAGRAPAAPTVPPQFEPLQLLTLVLIAAGLYGFVLIRKFWSDRKFNEGVPGLWQQYFALLGMGILYASLPVLESGGISWNDQWWGDRIRLWVVAVVFLTYAIFGTYFLVDHLTYGKKHSGWSWAFKKWEYFLPLLCHVVGMAGLVALGVWAMGPRDAQAAGRDLLFCERAGALGAGCSPVVAGLLIGGGLYAYGVISLWLLNYQSEVKIACPYPRFDPPAPNEPRVVKDVLNKICKQTNELQNHMVGAWSAVYMQPKSFVLVAVAAVLFLVVPVATRSYPTWDGPDWTWLLRFGILILFFLTLIGTFRLYVVWRQLERLLRLIGRVPMVGAFDRLPDRVFRVFGRWLLGKRRNPNDIVIPHQMLTELQERYDKLKPADKSEFKALMTAASAVSRQALSADDGSINLADIRAAKFSATAETFVRWLVPRWAGRPIHEAFGTRLDPAAKDEDPPDIQSLAEQFVALQAVVFLSQYMRQLRFIKFLAALPAAALLMAVTSYPFLPERIVMFSAAGIVVVVLAVILWVMLRKNLSGIISRVLRTTPDRFSLDAGFLSSFTMYVVPLLTLAVVQLGGRWRVIVEPILDLVR